MIRQRLIGTALAAALMAALPGATAAQAATPTEPEGVDWTLTSYYDEESAEMLAVPFGIGPTLRLEDGIASGFAGCNQFSGSYDIAGSSLVFSEEMTVTLALCADEVQTVEDAYLATLGEIDGWTIDLGTLQLSDDFGDVLLTLEVPHILWTTSQMTGIMTRLADLQAEVEALRGADGDVDLVELQDRVDTLETDNRKLKRRLDALEEEPEPTATPKPGQTASFSKAEKILLEGIPTRIANYCSPLRTQLPAGARAAVTCEPNTGAVSTVEYFLMNGDKAAAEFGRQMAEFKVPEATSDSDTCEANVRSQRYWIGGGWQAEGCYRHVNRAEVRFIDNATDCRQLKVDGKTLQSPTFLIALQGYDRDVAKVHAWATRNLGDDAEQLTSITKKIERPKGAWSPSCPT